MPQSPSPFTTRLAEFVGRLVEHLTSPDPEGDLPSSWRIALLAHLHAVGAVLGDSPESLGDPEPPAEPRFVPASISYRMVFPTPRDPASPRRDFALLLRAQRWRSILARASLAGRAELEVLLRDPEGMAVLAGDRRLACALRPLAWMLDVDAALLPRARPQPTVILVPGPDTQAARAEYVEARKTLTQAEVMERYCTAPTGPRPGPPRRPVWLGSDPCRSAVVSRLPPSAAGALAFTSSDHEMRTDASL